MEAVGSALRSAHVAFTRPRASAQARVAVIRAGTVCRTVVWPLFVPLAMHQYIRGVDRDMYASELLAYRSKSECPEEFYNKEKGRIILALGASLGELKI